MYAWPYLLLLMLLAACATYPAMAWTVHRRYGLVALATLIAACVLGYAYLSFRATCAQGMACDVGSAAAHASYLRHHVARFAVRWGCAFVAGSAGVLMGPRRRGGAPWDRWTLAVGALALCLGLALGGGLVMGFDRATCASRTYRAADGTISTGCDPYQ